MEIIRKRNQENNKPIGKKNNNVYVRQTKIRTYTQRSGDINDDNKILTGRGTNSNEPKSSDNTTNKYRNIGRTEIRMQGKMRQIKYIPPRTVMLIYIRKKGKRIAVPRK